MAHRNIIRIDEDKCTGCGLCVTGCAEGALKIIDGKARLIGDVYCDGLGACLEECPEGALTIITREAEAFDEEAVQKHQAGEKNALPSLEPLPCGCPGSLVQELPAAKPSPGAPKAVSTLRNWPVQLHLVPVKAPFFQRARLLIAADCTGFAAPNFHRDFLENQRLIIACPKLDQTETYHDKLAAIFRENDIQEITALIMTVPCCSGLMKIIRDALDKTGRKIPLRVVHLDPTGQVVEDVRLKTA